MISEVPPFSPSRGWLERRMSESMAAIHLAEPTSHWKFEVVSTSYFPFRVYASAVRGTGPNADEALVVALECHRPGGPNGAMVELQADISKPDGTVLSESPKYEIPLGASANQIPQGPEANSVGANSTVVAGHRFSAALWSLFTWLEHQTSLIERILSRAAGEEFDPRLDARDRLSDHASRLRHELSGKRRPTSAELLRRARSQGYRAA